MRAARTDLMQGFRFHATAVNASNIDMLQNFSRDDRTGYEAKAHAGFQNVTMPDVSVAEVEYREGIWKWTQKHVGPPTVTQVSMQRGITKRDTAFFDMVMASIDGAEYRSDVTIWHYQRSEMGLANSVEMPGTVRQTICHEAIATRAKPSGDLESMSGDVSLAELEMAVEWFEIKSK